MNDKTEHISPRLRAKNLCNIVYHNSMDENWTPFVTSRAIMIAKEIMSLPNIIDNSVEIKYWKKVISEIKKINK